MKELITGHLRFRQGYWRRFEKRFLQLARAGQNPHTMVVACSDSRVPPELIFDTAPGDIFVVRNVANLIPPFERDTGKHGTSAALEFAVKVLGVRDIVIMGHSQCGGIRALVDGPTARNGDFINSWMAIAQTARARVCDSPEAPTELDALCYQCEKESVRVSLANLMTFSWIAEAVEAGTLTLSGVHFNVPTGKIEVIA